MDRVQQQLHNLEVTNALNPCSNETFVKAQVGSRAADWQAMNRLIKLLVTDGGAGFPAGVLFNPLAGGLPAPTIADRETIKQLLDHTTTEGAKLKVKVCSPEFRQLVTKAGKAGLSGIQKYLESKCTSVLKFVSKTSARTPFLLNAVAEFVREVGKTFESERPVFEAILRGLTPILTLLGLPLKTQTGDEAVEDTDDNE